jgi:DNA-binding IclR family transcriptional regulator
MADGIKLHKAFAVRGQRSHSPDRVRRGTPYLQHITRELREAASRAALFDNYIEVVAVIQSPQLLPMSNVVGNILPPNASSLGKAITAFQASAGREKLIRSFGMFVLLAIWSRGPARRNLISEDWIWRLATVEFPYLR